MDLRRAKLLNVEELAQTLDLAPITIRQWAKERRIPCVRLGSRILFAPEDVEWIIQHNRVAAMGQEPVAVGTVSDA